MESHDELLKPAAVAAKLGVSTRTINRYIKARGLPAHRYTPKTTRLDPAAVEAWIAQRSTREDTR